MIMFPKRPFVLAIIALLLATALAFSRSRPTLTIAHPPKPADWPTFHANQFRTGSLDHIDGPATAKILWTFRETNFTPSDFSSSPAVVGNRIFVASANIDVVGRSGFVYCLDAITGQKIWQVPTQQEEKLDGHAVISAIARKRGYLRKGGQPDLEKAGRALMQDFRSGLLGRITLEMPDS